VLYKEPDFDKLLDKFNEMIKKGLRKTATSIIIPAT